ncbi:MAG TPA: hypothetical protein VF770_03740, partial [Solirubrobacterales bacterium]
MGEPAVQLKAVGEAREEIPGIAGQALEWVRLAEARVAEAEQHVAEAEARAVQSIAEADARAERARAALKERATATLRRLGEEGRERIAGERAERRE